MGGGIGGREQEMAIPIPWDVQHRCQGGDIGMEKRWREREEKEKEEKEKEEKEEKERRDRRRDIGVSSPSCYLRLCNTLLQQMQTLTIIYDITSAILLIF